MTGPSDPRPPLPLYLGPALPRWQPRTLADVRTVISDGTLRERHWLDVKAQLGTSDNAKNGFAKDLASFANDSGALLIGVAEDKQAGTLEVAPVLLAGLAERVDEIARSRCDPPLYVACHPIVDPTDAATPATGILLVEVPPSPSAPHQTDGRYYGRGDTTNRRLTDGEVARLHAVRTARQATAEQLIAAEIARDPVPVEHRELSHLYVVAEPLASPPDLLTSRIGTQQLTDQVRFIPSLVPRAAEYPPSWANYLRSPAEPRAHGSGFTSHGMFGRRFLPEIDGAEERHLLDVEVHDSGRVALFCGRGSDGYPDRDTGTERQAALTPLIATLTRCTVTLAGRLGADAGYAGRWLPALGVTDLATKMTSSTVGMISLGRGFPAYSDDHYIQGTEAVTIELLDQPGAVTRRLVGRLLRALGDDTGRIEPYLTDSPLA